MQQKYIKMKILPLSTNIGETITKTTQTKNVDRIIKLLPLERIVKEIQMPLYLKAYMSAAFGRDKILDP